MVVEIPVEVRIKEKKEVEELIKKLESGEATFRTEFKKGSKKTSGTSQAVPTIEAGERTGLAEAGIQTTPTRGRKDPLNLRKGKKTQILTKRDFDKLFKEKIGKAEGMLNMFSGKGPGPLGMLSGLATRLAPPLAVALIAIGFVEKVIEIAFGPGGPFDRRFNEFKERAKKLFSEQEQAQKRQGERSVRITSYYGSRGGRDTTYSTLDPLRRGTYAFDRDLEMLSRGVTD